MFLILRYGYQKIMVIIYSVLNSTESLLVIFLTIIYYERNNSPRTHNNYLSFIHTLCEFLVRKEFLKANPAKFFQKKKEKKKRREGVPADVRNQICDYLKKNKNLGMLTVVQIIYFQLIRRTELTKVKVSDINLKKKFIHIRPEVAKNGKERWICILDGFMPVLVDHLKKANNGDFLFSNNEFMPGRERLSPKKVSDQWDRMRKHLGFKKTYQLYSLKDSGITDMLLAGIPSVKVRDHAGHSTVSMTEKYTPRNNAEDLNLFIKEFGFTS